MERKKLNGNEIWVLEVLKERESYSTFVTDIVKGTGNWISESEVSTIVEKLKGVKYINHDAGDHSNLSISNNGKKELVKIEADKLAAEERAAEKKRKEKEQSEFHTSTTKKNQQHIVYMRIALIVLLADFIYRYGKMLGNLVSRHLG